MASVVYFPQKVKLYFLKKAIDVLVMAGLVHVNCPYRPEKDNLISQMRAKVIAGLLPSDVKKGGAEDKNGSGEGKNTKEGQKAPIIDYLSRLRGQNVEDWQNSSQFGGMNMVETGFMKKFLETMMERSTYTYALPEIGTVRKKFGAFWHGGQQNARTRKRIEEAWRELKPMAKDAYFFTVNIPKDMQYGDVERELLNFNEMTKELERRWRVLDGLAVFSALEYGSATGWHKHYILVTCEEDRHLAEVAQERITQMRLSSCTVRRRWNLEDATDYLLKDLSQTFEKMYDKIVTKNGEPDIYMKESFMVWYWCYQLNIRPYGHPKLKAIKGGTTQQEKIGRELSKGAKVHFLENYERGKDCSNREEAKKAFSDTHCEKCQLDCPISKWLRKYVYVDNSIQYKELTEFVAENY